MNTRALAVHMFKVKGLDSGERVLAKSVAGRVIYALRMQAKRGRFGEAGKQNGERVREIAKHKAGL
jgi:hypothetical protein